MSGEALPRRMFLALGDFTARGPRARQALASSLAVGVALTLALALDFDAPYWAAISAFICVQATQPQSLRRVAHRILGTVLGAAASYFFFPLVAYDHAGTLLLLFAGGTLAILGALVSAYSYAWLLGGLTMAIVCLSAIDDPTLLLTMCVYRAAEIVLGSVTALLVCRAVLPAGTAPAPAAPGWRSVLGENVYMVHHAAQTGVTLALVPVVWEVFALPDLSQMGISIGVIMAVPALTGEPVHDHAVMIDRALQRLCGCLIGGFCGIFLAKFFAGAPFAVWLAVLMATAAFASQIQTAPRDLGMTGVQINLAVILTMVQGSAPPTSLDPAAERLAGMLGAVTMLLIMHLIFGPSRRVFDPERGF